MMPVLVRTRLRCKVILLPRIQTLAQKILAAAGAPEAELSLDLVGDRRIRRLNRQYRGRDHPTDVLAFPMRNVVGPASPLLGDVVICPAVAAGQSPDLGTELRLLLVHGILHLLGYDHDEDEERRAMWARQERYSGVTL